MTQVKRIKYRSYAGPRIRGTEPLELSDSSTHWERVMYLTSKIESGGKYGSINMYDGTAATAGLHQAIAVYPRELSHEDYQAKDDQGSLWELLRRLEMIPDFPELQELWDKFAEVNWYVARDGSLRYLAASTVRVKSRNKKVKAGDIVFGFDIRETFTPNQGNVAVRGSKWEQSKSWALAFHKVFSHPKSFRAQIEFGMEHFERVAQNRKVNGETIEEAVYGGSIHRISDLDYSLDLAMAVFWSHSVNAPSIAYRILGKTIKFADPYKDPEKFSRRLLRLLATNKHGHWHFTEKSGRWQRTRKESMKIWDSSLFNSAGVMPKSY